MNTGCTFRPKCFDRRGFANTAHPACAAYTAYAFYTAYTAHPTYTAYAAYSAYAFYTAYAAHPAYTAYTQQPLNTNHCIASIPVISVVFNSTYCKPCACPSGCTFIYSQGQLLGTILYVV